jgi:hypothetical protein
MKEQEEHQILQQVEMFANIPRNKDPTVGLFPTQQKREVRNKQI